MGRGRSKVGGGGGGGSKQVTTVTVQSGATVQLDQPLVYGAKDPAVTGAVRTAIEAQETKRLTAKVEYAYVADQNGNQIGSERRGGAGSVSTPLWYFQQDATFTHNHPRNNTNEAGYLGGTFSNADLYSFSSTRIRTFRASAAEGTYSISKTSAFHARQFMRYANSLDKTATSNHKARVNKLAADVSSGKLTWSAYKQQTSNSFNSMLIELHNGLLAGQAQYGYTYTLEGR